ncbi:hypothetical protein GCM10023192_22550 [Amycolatopsis samaneae]
MNAALPTAYLAAEMMTFFSTDSRICPRVALAPAMAAGASQAVKIVQSSAMIIRKNMMAMMISMALPFRISPPVFRQVLEYLCALSAVSSRALIWLLSHSVSASAVLPRIAPGIRGSNALRSATRPSRSLANVFQASAIAHMAFSSPSGQVMPQVTLKNFCRSGGNWVPPPPEFVPLP